MNEGKYIGLDIHQATLFPTDISAGLATAHLLFASHVR